MQVNQTTFIKTLIEAARVYVSYETHEEPVAVPKEIVAIHKFDVELFEDGSWDVEMDVTYRDTEDALQFIHLVSDPRTFNVLAHGNTF